MRCGVGCSEGSSLISRFGDFARLEHGDVWGFCVRMREPENGRSL